MNVNYAYIESLPIYIEFKYIFLKFYIESKIYTQIYTQAHQHD